MIHKQDGEHFFDHGKYSNIPLKHVPTEHLDVIIANFYASNEIDKLRAVGLCITYKIKRIQDALDKLEPAPVEAVEKPGLIRRR